MAELSAYTVTINGIEHTMQLDKETAERLYGDDAVPASSKVSDKSDDAANKARRTRQ